jgi:hypothetical protein
VRPTWNALGRGAAAATAVVLALGAAPARAGGTPDGGVALSPGRTTAVAAALDVGAPVERAVPGRAYALAIARDGEQRWAEAAALYQQAVAEWTAVMRTRATAGSAPAVERAVQKAERERQRSQLLASLAPQRGRPDTAPSRMSPLDQARLYRTKLMVVRAFTGTVPAGLYARARQALEDALRGDGAVRPESEAEVRLLQCATHAAAGDARAARLARARVPEADRDQPGNALPMAVCAAALGEDDEALTRLELYVLHPPPHRVDAFTLRDLYVANDWDHLRGVPRFESLFR